MCLAVAPAFLTPGVDGGGSFRLLYMGDRKRWVYLDVWAQTEMTETQKQTGGWIEQKGLKTEAAADRGGLVREKVWGLFGWGRIKVAGSGKKGAQGKESCKIF